MTEGLRFGGRWFPALAAGFLVLGGFTAGMIASRLQHQYRPGGTVQVRAAGYDLTNPLLECEGAADTIGDYVMRPFKGDLTGLVGKMIAAGKIAHLSVYFRDLNNGHWHGVQENIPFYPASLLKVPVAMALMRQAEDEPGLLRRTIVNSPAENLNERLVFKPGRQIEPGRAYSLGELLERSLSESDNNAVRLLGRALNKQVLAQTFYELGVRYPVNGPVDFLSVREFATFFRILYNASYLDKSSSELLLSYLSKSSFRAGIAAGVPEGVTVAHKHGEQELRGGAEKELHDCGIVYYPQKPYLLCVMSKGDSFENNAEAIRDISRFVYEAVDAHRQTQSQAGR